MIWKMSAAHVALMKLRAALRAPLIWAPLFNGLVLCELSGSFAVETTDWGSNWTMSNKVLSWAPPHYSKTSTNSYSSKCSVERNNFGLWFVTFNSEIALLTAWHAQWKERGSISWIQSSFKPFFQFFSLILNEKSLDSIGLKYRQIYFFWKGLAHKNKVLL